MNVEWIGPRPSGVICSRFKKDLPLSVWEKHIRIAFRFETVYCKLSIENCLILRDGQIPIVHAYLPRHEKWIAGLRDLSAADNTPYSEDWRNILSERVKRAIGGEL